MIKFNDLKESDIVDVKSFKRCISSLTNKLGSGFNIEVSKKDTSIVYSICHNRSPIPSEVGEITLRTNNTYKVTRY